MTPAESTAHYAELIADLECAFASGFRDEAVASVLAEHDRALVAIFDADKASAVSLAREELAAERAAFADLAARQFWRGVCAERAMCADLTCQRYGAVTVPNQVPSDLLVADGIAARAVLDLSAAFAAEADVHRAWAEEG